MSIKRQVTDGRGTSSAFAPSCKKDFFEVVQGQICAHLFPNHNFLWSNEFFVRVSSPEWNFRIFRAGDVYLPKNSKKSISGKHNEVRVVVALSLRILKGALTLGGPLEQTIRVEQTIW